MSKSTSIIIITNLTNQSFKINAPKSDSRFFVKKGSRKELKWNVPDKPTTTNKMGMMAKK